MLKFFKNQKLSIIILSLSIIIFFHTYYKSEIIWAGKNLDFYKQYYFLSLIFFLIGIFFLFINKFLKKFFSIIFISTIFAFYLFEFYTVFVQDNSKNRYEIYKEMKKINQNLTVTVPPESYLELNKLNFFPLSGLSNMKTIFCDENGYMASYESDRYGFNNPDEQWDFDEYEFFVVGDSFGHGACVNRPLDITSKLRYYSKLPSINVSFEGNGPLAEYASLKEYSKGKKIKNIIWLYYEGNDLINLEKELQNSILIKYLYKSNFTQNLIEHQSKIDKYGKEIIKAEFDYQKKQKKIKIISFLKLQTLRKILQYEKIIFYNKATFPIEFESIVKKFASSSKKMNSNIFFVYLPSYASFSDSNYDKFYDKVLSTIKKESIEVIDLKQFFINNDPYSFFPNRKNGHYTPEGYDKIAKFIVESVNK